MKRLLPAAVAVAALCTPAMAETPLPRDPANVYGRFDNGLNYVIRPNTNPPGRVSVYLHVRTGALNESDDQNGLAHFLEHMAFNGSTHFPPGTLIPLLAGLGMTFGADTNAHTNLWETVYKLNLPNTQPETLDLGMKIFSDYASGLNLSDEEIESERKIILEEYRTGEGAGNRIGKQVRRDLFAGTRLERHDVIGDAEQIRNFSPAAFRKYYDRWYRPENMTLIVVGDVTPERVLPAAKRWLAGLSPRTPATRPQTAGLTPTTRPRAFVYTDVEQVTGEVGLSGLTPGRPALTTVEAYRSDVLTDLAAATVNRRLRNRVAGGAAPFRTAEVDAGDFLEEVRTADASAGGEPKDWRPMLSELVAEIDRAIEHGFSEAETKLVEKGLIAAAEQAVRAEASRDSSVVVDAIADRVGEGRPLLSAQQRLDLMRDAFAAATPADVHAAFRRAFALENYDYVVQLPASAAAPTPADVLAVADAAWKAATAPPTDTTSASELLPQQPTAGGVKEQTADADLAVKLTVFENGVVLHYKRTDYKKNSVLVSVTLPGGQLEETAETRGVSELAGQLFDRPATGRFTSTQLADLMTGKNADLTGSVGRDAMGLRLSCSPADLAAGMELAHALLTDGRLEQAAVDDWRKERHQQIDLEAKTADGRLRDALARTVYGGDPRFRPLTHAQVDRLTREQAQSWFDRIARNAAIEIAVVGDVDEKTAMDLTARYFGSLPKRAEGFDALDARRVLDRPAGPFNASETFDSPTPKALAVAGFIGCDENSLDRRPLLLAAEVLTDRMIARIREKEQLVYGIGASNQPGRGLPGTGLFAAGSNTDPKNGDRLADVVIEMLTEFARTGPTEAELATAKKQVVLELTTAMRDPGYWLSALGDVTYRRKSMEQLKQLPGVLDTYTAEQVRDVVAKYCTPERMIRMVMTPKTAGTTKPAAD